MSKLLLLSPEQVCISSKLASIENKRNNPNAIFETVLCFCGWNHTQVTKSKETYDKIPKKVLLNIPLYLTPQGFDQAKEEQQR